MELLGYCVSELFLMAVKDYFVRAAVKSFPWAEALRRARQALRQAEIERRNG